jgi:hypothetical protein
VGISVLRSFEPEVARAFRFLVAECGLSGPLGVGDSLLHYAGSGVTYKIRFDQSAGLITTTVTKDIGDLRLAAELPDLVLGAALGTPAHVRTGARTLTELRATVSAQAGFVRRLQPYLTPLNVLPLMRAAHARPALDQPALREELA